MHNRRSVVQTWAPGFLSFAGATLKHPLGQPMGMPVTSTDSSRDGF